MKRSVIPKIFHKTDGGYLEECIMCCKNLMSPACDYVIEKAIKKYPEYKKTDVVFEYAMCFDCAEKMRNELSEESRQRLEHYFLNHVDFGTRQNLTQPRKASFQKWIANCLISNAPIKKEQEYSVYAHAFGKNMVYDIFPYSVSGTVMEAINELLSEKTREVLDDFIGQHFSGPPEIAEILKRRPVLI